MFSAGKPKSWVCFAENIKYLAAFFFLAILVEDSEIYSIQVFYTSHFHSVVSAVFCSFFTSASK